MRAVVLEQIAAPNDHGNAAAEQTLLAESGRLAHHPAEPVLQGAKGERITVEEMRQVIEQPSNEEAACVIDPCARRAFSYDTQTISELEHARRAKKTVPPLGGFAGLAGFPRPVQIHDAEHADLGDRLLDAARTIGDDAREVLTNADLAFELNECALGQRARVVREFAENDTAVPGSRGLALARVAIFPEAVGCQ